MLTLEAAAKELDGMEYGDEGRFRDLFAEMKRGGLVAVFGASDDLIEFRGAINDEAGCGDGSEFRLTRSGLLESRCDEGDDCPYFKALLRTIPVAVKAQWASGGYSWFFDAVVPAAHFDILEEGDKYCRGVVIDLKDLPECPA